MSPSPLVLFSSRYVRSLTSSCDAELGSEASRAAAASRVEAQRLKEKAKAFRVKARHWELKAKGEFRRLPSLASLFFSLTQPHSVFHGAESEAEVTRAAEASNAV